ncbi:MAG TPA: hypothetical protein DCL73_12295 [Treponema sp.]|nr:hypothetical protein [Treponema sp.]
MVFMIIMVMVLTIICTFMIIDQEALRTQYGTVMGLLHLQNKHGVLMEPQFLILFMYRCRENS